MILGQKRAFTPLYIAQSGDLDRCYASLTDGQTLKDRATQLRIKYKSGALVTQFSGLSSKLCNWKLMNLIGNWIELMLHLAKFCALVILMTFLIKIVHNTKHWASKCHNTNFKITLFKHKSLTPKITHSPCLQSLCQCQCIALLRYENNLPCKF